MFGHCAWETPHTSSCTWFNYTNKTKETQGSTGMNTGGFYYGNFIIYLFYNLFIIAKKCSTNVLLNSSKVKIRFTR